MGRTLTNGGFELTKARGKPHLRSRCPRCMAEYYRSHGEKKRLKRIADSGGVLSVIPNGGAFEVRCTTKRKTGEMNRLVMMFATEQEAEKLVQELREGKVNLYPR